MSEYQRMQRPWTILESKEAITEQIAQQKDKLVVILFNLSEIPRHSVEYPLKRQRHTYEDSYRTVFFKCPVSQVADVLPREYSIKQVPTVVFYRNNEECGRLVKPTEDELISKLEQLK